MLPIVAPIARVRSDSELGIGREGAFAVDAVATLGLHSG